MAIASYHLWLCGSGLNVLSVVSASDVVSGDCVATISALFCRVNYKICLLQ